MTETKVIAVLFMVLGLVSQACAASQAKARPEQACAAEILKAKIEGGRRDHQMIKDAASGKSWRVAGDPRHPEWPARLVEVVGGGSCGDQPADPLRTGERRGMSKNSRAIAVRAGDWLRVSQDTRVVHAEFDAIALGGGMSGDSIKVRLRFGGKVMRVKVSAPGRALLIGNISEVHR
jgi:hypothetical protein